jgi:hypothetical protein
MRGNIDKRNSSPAPSSPDPGATVNDAPHPQVRLEQAVGHELAQRLLDALSGPHGRRELPLL